MTDFPIENLPYGVFRPDGAARVGVAIEESVLDLAAVAEAGLLDVEGLPRGTFAHPSLNPFLALGRRVWRPARARIRRLLEDGAVDAHLVRRSAVELLLPFQPGDYVDFYSSLEHATNLGRMFRPEGEPLLPNWRHLPVGYHGRSATVVVTGTPIVRPSGQLGPASFGPSRQLDIELEVGFVAGPGNPLGRPIPVTEAEDHIFGLVLVNDWSARDIQRWEYQPLGPFLGKSFATTVSPWVVPLEALSPYRVPGPVQDPPPLPYLRSGGNGGVDIQLEVAVSTASMDERGLAPDVISRTGFAGMYWTMAQQLAHATVNGAVVRPGDLFASGTVSGPTSGSEGSLIELAWRGERPITLADGSERSFLADGDTVVLRGWCGGDDGRPRIGFGECEGTVLGSPRP